MQRRPRPRAARPCSSELYVAFVQRRRRKLARRPGPHSSHSAVTHAIAMCASAEGILYFWIRKFNFVILLVYQKSLFSRSSRPITT
jgi:hypothetical protein